MSKKIIIILSIIVFFVGVVLLFIDFEIIFNKVLVDFSDDGIIKRSTYSKFNKLYLLLKISLLAFPVFLLIVFKFTGNIERLINFLKNKISVEVTIFFKQISLKSIFYVTAIIIMCLGIYAVENFDVGQDEAFYLNDIQNIEKYGAITRDRSPILFSYSIPNLPLNLIATPLVKIFGFNIKMIRYIILFFNVILIFVIYKLFKEKIALILIPLLYFLPGIYYLTSIIYLETVGLLFLLLGLYFYQKSMTHIRGDVLRINDIFGSLFMAIAMATKIQLFLYVPLIMISFIIVFPNHKITNLISKLIAIIIMYLGLLGLNYVIHGHEATASMMNFLFIGSNTAGAFTISIANITYKTLIVNNIIAIPLLFFIWVKSWALVKNNDSFVFKFIYLGAIVVTFHFLFFFSSYAWRNIFFGLVFNLVLLTLLIEKNIRQVKIVLIPYILVGIVANYAFIKNGVTDDVQYYRTNTMDKPFSLQTNNSQKEFFHKASEILPEGALIYSPVQPFIPRLYLPNHEVTVLREYKILNSKNQYLVLYPGAVKEKYIQKLNYQTLLDKSNKLLQVGAYALYELP